MRQVVCRSGIKGWQAKLNSIYSDFEEFEAYDKLYGISYRLGFKSAKNAWLKNPTVQGSVIPSDYRKIA